MPRAGIVYQVHSGRLTEAVISSGSLQVAPSSLLLVTHTEREWAAPFATIAVSSPSFRFRSSQMTPVSRS